MTTSPPEKHADPVNNVSAPTMVGELFRVFISTWNVGDAAPSPLESLFAHATVTDSHKQKHVCELVVLAAQECEYTPPAPDQKTKCEAHWINSICKALPNYAVVKYQSMWSIRLAVLCQKQVVHHVTDVKVSVEATGIAHLGGNKGGVAIGITFFGSRLLFVGAHLAAHLKEVERRNSDFHEITEGISASLSFQGIQPLNYYHHVFWCGDLNYRIDLPVEEATKLANDGSIEKLWEKDQLQQQMEKKMVFYDFTEDVITFRPTYRCVRNTLGPIREYDKHKNRVPSWCDRILHKSLGHPADFAKSVKYFTEAGMRSSDHSPVFAIFEVDRRDRLMEKFFPNSNGQQQLTFLLQGPPAGSGKQSPVTPLQSPSTQRKRSYSLSTVQPDKILLKISKMKGANLLAADIGGTSDPYIVWNLITFAVTGRTKTCPSTLNPDWGNEVIQLDLGQVPAGLVGLDYLHGVVMDADVTSDDPLGQVVMPLEVLMPHNGGESKESHEGFFTGSATSHDVTLPVMHFGRPIGTISFTVELNIVMPLPKSSPLAGSNAAVVVPPNENPLAASADTVAALKRAYSVSQNTFEKQKKESASIGLSVDQVIKDHMGGLAAKLAKLGGSRESHTHLIRQWLVRYEQGLIEEGSLIIGEDSLIIDDDDDDLSGPLVRASTTYEPIVVEPAVRKSKAAINPTDI